MNMKELVVRVRKVIFENRYLTMATSDGKTVWIAPLAYYVEPDYSFVYFTSKSSRHQKHIEKKSIVACSIYNSSLSSDEVDGIQFTGKVTLVSGAELPTVLAKYFMQSFPIEEVRKKWLRPVSDFKFFSVQRFYRIKPLDMYTIDTTSVKVDKRVEVDLNLLKKEPLIK